MGREESLTELVRIGFGGGSGGRVSPGLGDMGRLLVYRRLEDLCCVAALTAAFLGVCGGLEIAGRESYEGALIPASMISS